jgi:hypothetical protein
MKTKILISIATLIFNVSLVFAGNDYFRMMHNPPAVLNTDEGISVLLPATPKEATFEEVSITSLPMEKSSDASSGLALLNAEGPIMDESIDLTLLAPVVPKEATFDESDDDDDLSPAILKELAPVTPREASFNDNSYYLKIIM